MADNNLNNNLTRFEIVTAGEKFEKLERLANGSPEVEIPIFYIDTMLEMTITLTPDVVPKMKWKKITWEGKPAWMRV